MNADNTPEPRAIHTLKGERPRRWIEIKHEGGEDMDLRHLNLYAEAARTKNERADLLAALSDILSLATYPGDMDPLNVYDFIEDLKDIHEAASAAIAKAEGK